MQWQSTVAVSHTEDCHCKLHTATEDSKTMLEKVRIDKWLWSVRIFKSRTIATDACKSGKIKIGEKKLKPSYLLVRDEEVTVHKNGFNLQYKVVDLLGKRVSAALAQVCYEDLTPAEELNKYKDWYVGKAVNERRERGAGRPTKKERREIDDYKVDENASDEYLWEE